MPDHIADLDAFLSRFASEAQEFADCEELHPTIRQLMTGMINRADQLRGDMSTQRMGCHNTLTLKPAPKEPTPTITRTKRCTRRSCAMFCANPINCPEK